ncbi:3-deoxy-D-manno-octulosonic acid transferase [Roseovarius sp. SCSIO 43702]|uniref:3-deoxy-D-manno-octulosonic acid transferase n=1 Tax=Roseovarius sp. SCSIO 43702 TaxID=2823043 RepID=UPI001C737BB3|nr:glycosyltransferase N-terminal domain-containing protein [Roseovarius sp. SCSIO 43702]QYX56881.1 3-deoxy-D-manno-octulosonic acid transferase [Roseovarius sp. SCSIO 43702]
MARSISLSAYMAMARKGQRSREAPVERAPRPDGELVWGHASTVDHAHALVQMADRLIQLRPDLTLLLTTPPKLEGLGLSAPWLRRETARDDTVAEAEAFLDHWHPDLCLWTGGSLQPALLTCADHREIPLFLVDVDEAVVSRPGWRLLPDVSRSVLKSFSMILARNAATERALHRLGISPAEVAVTGVFQEGTRPLPCDEGERQALSDVLASRPVWLAAMAQLDELDVILAAHRQTSRIFHRLMLILVPDAVEDGDAFAERLEAEGLSHVRWSEGKEPDTGTQVLLGDTHGDLGLWYRLATISLMCSSLVPGHGGRDPNEPAAHGSAVLYGPNVSRYLAAYKRFAGAGAARIVRDTETLAAALERLIAPDQSAAMAHAAWEVASVGAEVTDRILDLVQDTLDVLEAT